MATSTQLKPFYTIFPSSTCNQTKTTEAKEKLIQAHLLENTIEKRGE